MTCFSWIVSVTPDCVCKLAIWPRRKLPSLPYLADDEKKFKEIMKLEEAIISYTALTSRYLRSAERNSIFFKSKFAKNVFSCFIARDIFSSLLFAWRGSIMQVFTNRRLSDSFRADKYSTFVLKQIGTTLKKPPLLNCMRFSANGFPSRAINYSKLNPQKPILKVY
jgi:hypothetical protein